MVVTLVLVGCGAAMRGPEAPVTEVTDPDVIETWASARLVRYAFEPFVPPTPPMQNAPWEPPEGLDPALAETVRVVFAGGYPDPRGCAYRMVEVRQRSLWDEGEVVRLPMFVLPGETAAIDWYGVVVRVVSVGEPADLEAHAALVREAISAASPESPGSLYAEPLRALGLRATTHASVIFARLGLVVGLEPEPISADTILGGWRYGWAEHALLCFMRGDDDEALFALDTLDDLDPLPEGARVSTNGNAYELRPAMRAELSRRITATSRLEIDGDRFHADLSDVPTDVLVEALDEVRARQLGQPGGLNFLWEPVPHALVARGEEVLEPLLDVLERDPRLTRSVHFWRDFAPDRTMSAVYEVAYVVLANVLDWSLFDTPCTGCDLTNAGVAARERVATEMRAFWTTTGRLTPAQRMLAVLADDHAEPAAWAQAALRLLARGDVDYPEASSLVIAFPEEGAGAGRLVDALSDEERGSLTVSLIARLTAVMALPHDEFDHDAECDLAAALVEWDREGGREPLVALAERCLSGDIDCACRAGLVQAVSDLETATIERLADFLRTDHVTAEDLLLAATLRDHPRIALALAEVFAPGASVWSDTELRDVFVYDVEQMLGVPEVREEAVRRLTSCDETVRVEVRANRVTVTASSWSISRPTPPGVGEVPDTNVVAHDCDVFASQLAERLDRPAFSIWASEDHRGRERAGLVEVVRTWTPPAPRVIDVDSIRLEE